MSFKILHQCGHNTNWDIDSFLHDGCGDGLILSPVHFAPGQIERLDKEVREASFFDPQFYLPNSQKKKLASYSFFPETISCGFSTSEFSAYALEAARQCVRFQVEQQFNRIVVPSRYIDQMRRDYTEQQDEYTLHPFLQIIEDSNVELPVFLSLALTAHMLDDVQFVTELLDWVTSYPRIDGIYINVAEERATKQSQSAVFLRNYLKAIKELRNAGLSVTAGHLNCESFLLCLADGVDVTFGAYENTRMFSVDKFVVTSEERRGPRARIYVDGLLNWILLSEARELKKAAPSLWASVFTDTEYSGMAFDVLVEPTFNQPLLYKHHFMVMDKQIRDLKDKGTVQRTGAVMNMVLDAQQAYREIARIGFQLDRHSCGEHLDAWRSVIEAI